ncbi:hypothetical protein BDZ89DRAFT_1049797 [Hymenopellis radicata]|nr:hypothetical protein BDZ89DRAFT_1049797 [Hymenopellis radicata]
MSDAVSSQNELLWMMYGAKKPNPGQICQTRADQSQTARYLGKVQELAPWVWDDYRKGCITLRPRLHMDDGIEHVPEEPEPLKNFEDSLIFVMHRRHSNSLHITDAATTKLGMPENEWDGVAVFEVLRSLLIPPHTLVNAFPTIRLEELLMTLLVSYWRTRSLTMEAWRQTDTSRIRGGGREQSGRRIPAAAGTGEIKALGLCVDEFMSWETVSMQPV